MIGTDERALAACPFCGGPADYEGGEHSGYVVRCKHCGASSGWGDYGYQAANSWNRRLAQPDQSEPVAWLIEWRDCGAADRASSKRRCVHLHNAIGDYRELDPDATSTQLVTATDYAALRAERDALVADAERYRWIRSEDGCPFAETDKAWDSGADLDAAIDAARKP